eukprot:TRINITY_DN3208_c0_g1_i1.p1 TRINITY_DN3208_c0_g1~~TRINITY_DN3208_c0_g1_i1.p1  ORF type:complete len:939 (+),score=213.43 TRINITY_DN3208_c0_g1_i1:46-2862(+)
MADNVKVAVRMRPFNSREKDMKTTACVRMDGQQLVIWNPDKPDDTNEFGFDFCYDSMDSGSPSFASQDTVFRDLGTLFLESCWEGYNSTLFAYGQTGAGKSFSMMGYGDQLGIIPLGCAELFRRIEENHESSIKYWVETSYLEIYNEQIQDLFNPKARAGGLKLREDPKLGVFVEALTKIAVTTYKEIERLMEQGSAARTVAATKMNATSSRSHSVFTLRMVQQKLKDGHPQSQRVSIVNLVDLAGSERQQATGAEGQRLREACAINKSLSALGNVIGALADMAKGKKTFVPYRDSILTRMLQQSLGGNAKTVMIAAISPASVNYDESLSTLRFADRAKKIVNRAIVNETAQDKLIRELKEELERLRTQAVSGTFGGDDMRAALEETKAALKEATEGFEAKLARAKQVQDQLDNALEDMGLSVKELSELGGGAPQLVNLSSDALLAGNLVYYLPEGDAMIGTAETEGYHCIKVIGTSVAAQHAQLLYVEGRVSIRAVEDARTFVNGELLTHEWRRLHSGDRIIVGRGFIFRFVYDADKREGDAASAVPMSAEEEWEQAMREFAAARGEAMTTGVAQELVTLAELIGEANDIAERMNAHVVFALHISDEQREGDKKLNVKTVDILAQRTSVWTQNVFEARLAKMRALFTDFVQSGTINIPDDDNPFFEPMPDQLIGIAYVPLHVLASGNAAESDVWYPIFSEDGKGPQNGEVHLFMSAEAEQHSMRRYHFELTEARDIDTPYRLGMWCRFDFPDDGELEITERSDTDIGYPIFAFIADWDLPHDAEMLRYLEETVLPIEVFGYAPAPRKEIGAKLKMSLAPGSLADVQAQLLCEQIERAAVEEKCLSLVVQCETQLQEQRLVAEQQETLLKKARKDLKHAEAHNRFLESSLKTEQATVVSLREELRMAATLRSPAMVHHDEHSALLHSGSESKSCCSVM